MFGGKGYIPYQRGPKYLFLTKNFKKLLFCKHFNTALWGFLEKNMGSFSNFF